MNKLVIAGVAVLCLAPLAMPMLVAEGDEFPAWAYPADPPAGPGGAARSIDDGTQIRVPGSEVALSRSEVANPNAVPDWHPNDHPPMPAIVGNGREGVRACAACHQPSGAGRPDNASLAGLTETYIKQQIANFKDGNRKSSAPDRAPQAMMNQIAANLTEEEIAEATKYFSGLMLGSYVKVVEADMVPETFVTGGILAALPEGGMEPIGQRIVEVPEDLERARNRDPRTPYIAYVPKGSIERGKILVTGGALPCTACHGPDLHGVADIPHIGGRSPSYIVRQLYDIKNGTRAGSTAPMQQVVSDFELDDMIAIAAYVASQAP